MLEGNHPQRGRNMREPLTKKVKGAQQGEAEQRKTPLPARRGALLQNPHQVEGGIPKRGRRKGAVENEGIPTRDEKKRQRMSFIKPKESKIERKGSNATKDGSRRRGRNIRGQGKGVHGEESPRRSKWLQDKEKPLRKEICGGEEASDEEGYYII